MKKNAGSGDVASFKPGTVLFARIRGYPWWPAIVGRCHLNGLWKNEKGQIWVYFVDEDKGAWMKAGNTTCVLAYDSAHMTSNMLKKDMLLKYPHLKATITDAYYLAAEFINVRDAGFAHEIPFVFNAILTADAIEPISISKPIQSSSMHITTPTSTTTNDTPTMLQKAARALHNGNLATKMELPKVD